MVRAMAPGRHPRRAEGGYTLVVVLALTALAAIALAEAGTAWSKAVHRDRERDLLRTGALYAQALADYRDRSQGSVRRYPAQLDDLLKDARTVGLNRDLRRLYPDPVAPELPWGLIRDDQGNIIGVHSQSQEAPLATAPQVVGPLTMPPVARYADWLFMAPSPASAAADGRSASSPAAARATAS